MFLGSVSIYKIQDINTVWLLIKTDSDAFATQDHVTLGTFYFPWENQGKQKQCYPSLTKHNHYKYGNN